MGPNTYGVHRSHDESSAPDLRTHSEHFACELNSLAASSSAQPFCSLAATPSNPRQMGIPRLPNHRETIRSRLHQKSEPPSAPRREAPSEEPPAPAPQHLMIRWSSADRRARG